MSAKLVLATPGSALQAVGVIDDGVHELADVEMLKAVRPEFDFLDYEEAERLVKAAEDEWSTMILVALRTGMRHGELIALRWEDVDLVQAGSSLARTACRDAEVWQAARDSAG